MAGRLALMFFGFLVGVIFAIALMSTIVVSPSLTDQKTLGDMSNLVVALGAVFTLGYTLWQQQQTLDKEKKQSEPRLRLVGAPMAKLPSVKATIERLEVAFQFSNDGTNPAAQPRFRIFRGPLSQPHLLVLEKEEFMANPIFGGQGFHWVLKVEFPQGVDPKANELFVYIRLDYQDTSEDGDALFAQYFLKLNHSEGAVANASMQEVSQFKTKISQMI